jgi:hypothetical protein
MEDVLARAVISMRGKEFLEAMFTKHHARGINCNVFEKEN